MPICEAISDAVFKLVSKNISTSSGVSGSWSGSTLNFNPEALISLSLSFSSVYNFTLFFSMSFSLLDKGSIASTLGYILEERILFTTIFTNLGTIGTGVQSNDSIDPSPLFGSKEDSICLYIEVS